VYLRRDAVAAVKKDERGERPGPGRLDETPFDARRCLRRRVLEGNGAGAAGAESGQQNDPNKETRRHAPEYIASVTRTAP